MRSRNNLRTESLRRHSIVAMVLLLVGCASTRQANTPTPTSEDLARLNLDQHLGKVVYIDFWASWCIPCQASFPWMQSMQQKYRDDGLVIVAVNVDRDRVSADNFLASRKTEFEVIYDPSGEMASAFDLPGMPTSFFVDRRGAVRGQHVGFRENDTSDLERMIQSLLEEKSGDAAVGSPAQK